MANELKELANRFKFLMNNRTRESGLVPRRSSHDWKLLMVLRSVIAVRAHRRQALHHMDCVVKCRLEVGNIVIGELTELRIRGCRGFHAKRVARVVKLCHRMVRFSVHFCTEISDQIVRQ